MRGHHDQQPGELMGYYHVMLAGEDMEREGG